MHRSWETWIFWLFVTIRTLVSPDTSLQALILSKYLSLLPLKSSVVPDRFIYESNLKNTFVLSLPIGHTPIVASNQNLTQTTNVHQNATVNHPQNLFDLRSHFQNRSRLFENQRVQSASQVEKPIINSSNPGTSQQRQHLVVRSPKKKTKENSSNVMNAQSSTATYQIQSTNTFPDSAARSQSTNTIPDLAIRRTNTFPDPELAARSTVDDESPNHLSVDELFPILADEERSIVDELRQLDQRTSALNEQVSIIFLNNGVL